MYTCDCYIRVHSIQIISVYLYLIWLSIFFIVLYKKYSLLLPPIPLDPISHQEGRVGDPAAEVEEKGHNK